ncbi:MAG: hypothetical protein Nkreftii_004011 [Candidatus Nitrospira kreftii]|uniref:Uncharacterized protein n=1 Tax=Candidatus Nitrospira kreftii TaxID=2652173 RepID=A0A7S8FI39_9BACT|nr:MAG: hypothetical protein Nkreftii_004011 [Candidatus Nitrospira kreftii]
MSAQKEVMFFKLAVAGTLSQLFIIFGARMGPASG